MDKPEKNTTGKPRPVPEDVAEKQDPDYSKADFDIALKRAARRLDRAASEHGRGSSRR